MKIYKDKLAYELIARTFYIDTVCLGKNKMFPCLQVHYTSIKFETGVYVQRTKYDIDDITIENYTL